MEYFEVITDAKTGEVTKRPYTPAEMEVVNAALAEREANAYKDQRTAAYPSIQEQLDMQYWDGVNGTTVWADTIAKIKAEFPKP
jgi:hypothetical protein